MFNLFPIYSARKSSNHKLFINHKISPDINLHKTKHTNIKHTFSTGTCLRQCDLFYPAGLHRNHVLATANTRKIGRGFGKMQVNGPEG